MQLHVVSCEGPDVYSHAGGLATCVEGLAETLAVIGLKTQLWFIDDPDLPGYETQGSLHLHRWAQWVSRYHPAGRTVLPNIADRSWASSTPTSSSART